MCDHSEDPSLTVKKQRPALILLDNRPDSVEKLARDLRAIGSTLCVVAKATEYKDKIAGKIFDIALLDVCLHDPADAKDRSGIQVAAESAPLTPETMYVFISRPVIVEDAGVVLQMFNRQVGAMRDRSQRVRLAEGYADKESPPEVVAMAKDVLGSMGLPCEDISGFPIEASSDCWSGIAKALEYKVRASLPGRNLVEPEEQFLRILRQLSHRDFLKLNGLALNSVSKGRSRSIVLSVTARYGQDEVRTIVKIGARVTIEMERDNYSTGVPKLLQVGKYPMMTGFTCSRQLAGIAYSELGKGEALPRTFSDEFWKYSPRRVQAILDEVFHQIIMPPRPPTATDTSLISSYRRRFQTLASGSALFDEHLPRIRQKCHFIKTTDACDRWTLKVDDTAIEVMAPDRVLQFEAFKWDTMPHFECLLHGDLHGDNIIISDESDIFLIDFTHTAPHHAALDFVIMESMVRNQFLRDIFENQERHGFKTQQDIQRIYTEWVRLELLFAQEEWKRASDYCGSQGLEDTLGKLVSVVKWLRHNAKLHNYYEDYRLYQAGLGMVALSFLSLPDQSPHKSMFQSILLISSTLALNNSLDTSSTAKMVYLNPLTGLAAQDKHLAEVFCANRLRIERNMRDRMDRVEAQLRTTGQRGNTLLVGKLKALTPALEGGVRRLHREVDIMTAQADTLAGSESSPEARGLHNLVAMYTFLQELATNDEFKKCELFRIIENCFVSLMKELKTEPVEPRKND
jgi:hypothetical protein